MKEFLNFDGDWYFHRGEIDVSYSTAKEPIYMSSKTERALRGPAFRGYQPIGDWKTDGAERRAERWESVTLPHDYLFADESSREYNETNGFVRYDNAWYLKKFRLDKSDAGKRLTLRFEGAANHATVWLNGCLLKRNFCGYTPFEVDITDVADFEEENSLAVYVENETREGWWYEGAGIYRHVTLVKSDLVSLDRYGVFACPEKIDERNWIVRTEITVRNDGDTRRNALLCAEIRDGERSVASCRTAGSVGAREKRTFVCKIPVTDPHLWDPENPHRYTMRTTLSCGKNPDEINEVRFGFRTCFADAENGFFINGKPYKIKGVCAHENTGLTGKAIPDNLQRYRVRLMKEMGANGYRASHYPQSEALMEALDEAGFIVMDETRWFESSEEGLEQLETLVKRDRNRPCVFFWSLGNEEPLHATERGRRIFRSMRAHLRKFDDSRIVMTADSYLGEGASVFDDMDLIPLNYNWKHYDELRRRYPHKPFLSSENCATGTTRGWYYPDDPVAGLISAYDKDTNKSFLSRESTWKFIASRDWILGGYQWAGFEHRGESVWPRLCSVSGAVDLFLQKKDAWYQNRSQWSDEPLVHLLPHWNFRGMEGEPIRVVAYTNVARADLYLNGEKIGSQTIERYGHAEWQVPYAPGRIEVKGYDGEGRLVATDSRETTGTADRLCLHLDNPESFHIGDLAIVTCTALDTDGREVPDACPTIRFSVSGGGTLHATGSSIVDHLSATSPVRRMWMGKITLAVRITGDAPVRIVAEGENLGKALLKF